MANYTMQSFGGDGLFLSIDGTPTQQRNVLLKTRSLHSTAQAWRIDAPGDGIRTRIFSAMEENKNGYALNMLSTGVCNLISHVGNYQNSLLSFELYSPGVYYVQHVQTGKCLTAKGSTDGSSVCWETAAHSAAQRWKLSQISDGAGPFSVSSFGNGLSSGVIHTNSNSTMHIYKFSATEKLRLGITLDGCYAISSDKHSPTGKTVTAKMNCAFYNFGEHPSFNGLFKSGGNLYYDSASVTIPAGQEAITKFISDQTHFPCFCVPSSGSPVIKWFANYTAFLNSYQSYEYIMSGGHALVYNGKNIYDNHVLNDQSLTIACPLIYAPTSSHLEKYADISWDDPATKRQRSILGYAGGRYYLMVSPSMTIFAAAQAAKELGCTWAMSFDGSYSSCLRVGSTDVLASERVFSTALCACSN